MLLVRMLLVVALSILPVLAGKIVHLTGNGFSLEISQPEGWILDTSSAPQIAAMVFYPEGTDWRRSDARIFVRFTPRPKDTNFEEFVEEDRGKFEEECPFADPEEDRFEWQDVEDRFRVSEYRCPGIRNAVVAFSETEQFVVIVELSAETGVALQRSISPLREILASFQWQEVPVRQ